MVLIYIQKSIFKIIDKVLEVKIFHRAIEITVFVFIYSVCRRLYGSTPSNPNTIYQALYTHWHDDILMELVIQLIDQYRGIGLAHMHLYVALNHAKNVL